MDILKINFKNKFIIFTLCFTFIFSSLNIKRSYADGGVISLPILATVSTLAVGSGIALNNGEHLYNLGRQFYETYRNNWNQVEEVFNTCVTIGKNNVVTVGKEFLDYTKNFFDETFKKYDDESSMFNGSTLDFSDGLFVVQSRSGLKGVNGFWKAPGYCVDVSNCELGQRYSYNSYFDFQLDANGSYYRVTLYKGDYSYSFNTQTDTTYFKLYKYNGNLYYNWLLNNSLTANAMSLPFNYSSVSYSLPYSSGSYDWDKVQSNSNEDNSVSIYVPGNLGDLLGVPSDTVFNPSYDLPVGGVVGIPSIDNPVIGVGDGVFNPSVDVPDDDVINPPVDVPDDDVINPPVDVPNEGIWATIKDFIISLVVPSDTFWTDTWNDLYNNFTVSFPGVDMDNFNSLVTGEKKFPNIDINIMGVKGRVVNGDVINSIVDWLRPIIAGFIMLCLMFFNYRKIYKLIRNSEPFGGIAPGTSDFSTGISETSKGGK